MFFSFFIYPIKYMHKVLLSMEKFEIYMRNTNWSVCRYCLRDLVSESIPRMLVYFITSIIVGIKLYEGKGGGEDSTNYSRDKQEPIFILICCLLLLSHILCWFIPVILDYLDIFYQVEALIPWHFEHIGIRFRAWIMLLYGEGVLSIIIVPLADDSNYYIAFFASVLLLQVLQLTQYSSEDIDHNDTLHAMFKSINTRRLWIELVAIQSLAIIVLGVALQLYLKDIACLVNETTNYSPPSSHLEVELEVDEEKDNGCQVPSDRKRLHLNLLCYSCIIQYIIQQVIIVVHVGMVDHFNYMKGHRINMGLIKLITLIAFILLLIFPTSLNSYVIVLVVASITTVQGAVQLLEHMIIHVARCKQKLNLHPQQSELPGVVEAAVHTNSP